MSSVPRGLDFQPTVLQAFGYDWQWPKRSIPKVELGRLSTQQLHALFVQEGPRFRTVESPDSHGCDQRRIEIAEVHTVPRPRGGWKGLPVRHAAAGTAMDGPQRAVALHVCHCVLGVAFDLDRAELEVDPRPTNAAAQRAVALRLDGGRRR
jgi:hypothetical protein